MRPWDESKKLASNMIATVAAVLRTLDVEEQHLRSEPMPSVELLRNDVVLLRVTTSLQANNQIAVRIGNGRDAVKLVERKREDIMARVDEIVQVAKDKYEKYCAELNAKEERRRKERARDQLQEEALIALRIDIGMSDDDDAVSNCSLYTREVAEGEEFTYDIQFEHLTGNEVREMCRFLHYMRNP